MLQDPETTQGELTVRQRKEILEASIDAQRASRSPTAGEGFGWRMSDLFAMDQAAQDIAERFG